MALSPYSDDIDLLRRTFAHFPTGVAAIAAEIDGAPDGMVVSSFTVGVSMEPPLVLFAVQNGSSTWSRIRGAKRLGVSVLGEGMASAAIGLSSRDRSKRFAGLSTEVSESGALFVHGSSIWLECSVRSANSAGDHEVVLLTIESLHADAGVAPLVYHAWDFRRLGEPEPR
jgi:flavin reductase (DIM6/NTAB) family NADH-FMN oxidoreductase RutF